MRLFDRQYVSAALGALFILLLTVTTTSAITFEKEDNIHISNLHRIDDDLIAWGSNITVDGLIEGDLIAGGYTVNTNGHVRGSENVCAFKFHHTGTVDGALRGFVNFCEVDGYVGRSVLIVGNDIRIGEKAAIEKEAIIRGATVHFNGRAWGDIDIAAENVFISGIIGGDARLEGKSISVTAPAVIKGNLTYITQDKDNFELASGVTVLGETIWEEPKSIEPEAVSDITRTVVEASCLLAAFLFGFILLILFRKYATEAANQLRERTAVATAAGLLTVIVFAVSLVILIIAVSLVIIGLTLVYGEGAMLGVFVLALSVLLIPITSFITVSGGILFYSGKIIIALLGGYYLVRLVKPNAVYLGRFQLLLGLIVLALLFSIPFYVGFLIYLIVSIMGTGAIALGIKHCRRELNDSDKSFGGDAEGPPQPESPSELP